MAVQSIKRVFTSLHTIAQYLAEIGFTGPSRHTCLQKCTISQLVLAFIAKLAVKRLPNSYGIAIGSGSSTVTTDNAFPQKLIAIARPYLQQRSDTCEQIQESLKHKKYYVSYMGLSQCRPLLT